MQVYPLPPPSIAKDQSGGVGQGRSALDVTKRGQAHHAYPTSIFPAVNTSLDTHSCPPPPTTLTRLLPSSWHIRQDLNRKSEINSSTQWRACNAGAWSHRHWRSQESKRAGKQLRNRVVV